MKKYLVDFGTAETIKAQLLQEEPITFTNILGFEQKVTQEELLTSIRDTASLLCKEIADKILEINGGAPSALFLAGGGSKLAGLKDELTVTLGMDETRVAVAGNYFQANACSAEYDLNNPEYATPLGIVVSSGLNMINDSFRVMLNGRPAKLFRTGSFTALNLLMMNGYTFRDIIGRSGANLTVTVNGRRKVFYGTATQPASLLINQQEGRLSEVIHAGDIIDFVPAVQGQPARPSLGDIEGAADCTDITLNGMHVSLKTFLKNGDSIMMELPPTEKTSAEKPEPADQTPVKETLSESTAQQPAAEMPEARTVSEAALQPEAGTEPPAPAQSTAGSGSSASAQTPASTPAADVPTPTPRPAVPRPRQEFLFHLNGSPLRLPRKPDGSPYYLMDLIEYSGIDLKEPKGRVKLTVNGRIGMFQQALSEGDSVQIEEEQEE